MDGSFSRNLPTGAGLSALLWLALFGVVSLIGATGVAAWVLVISHLRWV